MGELSSEESLSWVYKVDLVVGVCMLRSGMKRRSRLRSLPQTGVEGSVSLKIR